MAVYLSKHIKIGISACMYNCRYRYNAKGWDQLNFLGRDRASYTWFPVCPEVNAGFGVPREAIKITGASGTEVWQGKAKIISSSGKDLSEKLTQSCKQILEQLKNADVSVFIYMEGSPSCGVYRTTLKNKRLGKPPGVFGSMLLKEGFFLIPAQDLSSPIKWWDWRRRMLAFVWLKEQPLETKKDFYAVWHTLKFLCQEIDEKRSRELGKIFADFDKHTTKETGNFEAYRSELLDILRRPSTTAKIKNRLWKHYSYFVKHSGKVIENVKEPSDLRNMSDLAKELLQMELNAMETGIMFGASPIINRKAPQPQLEHKNE